MQRSARKTTYEAPEPAKRLPAPMAINEDYRAAAYASPARDLQDRLRQDLGPAGEPAPVEGRWSARRSLAFTVGASLLLWGGIGWVASRLLS